jgi:hypothetical protein
MTIQFRIIQQCKPGLSRALNRAYPGKPSAGGWAKAGRDDH